MVADNEMGREEYARDTHESDDSNDSYDTSKSKRMRLNQTDVEKINYRALRLLESICVGCKIQKSSQRDHICLSRDMFTWKSAVRQAIEELKCNNILHKDYTFAKYEQETI